MNAPAKILFHALRYRLRDLPFAIEQKDDKISIHLQTERKARWKGKELNLTAFKDLFATFDVSLQAQEMNLQKLPQKKWATFLHAIEEMADLIARENLNDEKIWGIYPHPHSTGFKEGTLPQSTNYLKELYADGFVVPEKKGFVIDLRRSSRDHLISVDEDAHSFFDAASQIATLALGYNDPEKRGMILHPEHVLWSYDPAGSELHEAYMELLRNQSGLPHVYFFNSGAEANEAALQMCLRNYPDRRKLLAFNGSFHGRSFVTLHITHSPSKRLIFETFPDLVTFAPYPETKHPTEKPPITEEWRALWAATKNEDYTKKKEALSSKADDLTKKEIESLDFIRGAFQKEPYLACIIEPRQCEGGDRFATARFYHGLRLLTRALDVPLIFDEVQTGFGLGGPFFWHEQFDLRTADEKPDHPDCLTFAKKAQVSGVATHFNVPQLKHSVSSASLHRGYLQAMAQLVQKPVNFDAVMKRLLAIQSLVGSNTLQNPRGQALTFAFDLPSDVILNKLISYRFDEGILFYPAGERTARFRLLRNHSERELDGLFTSLYRCFLRGAQDKIIPEIPPLSAWLEKVAPENRELVSNVPLKKQTPWKKLPTNTEELKSLNENDWQDVFVGFIKEERACLQLASNKHWTLEKLALSTLDDLVAEYKKNQQFTWMDLLWQASRLKGWKLERIKTPAELSKLRPQIEALEKSCYEKARQSPYEDFEKCLKTSRGIILISREGDTLAGLGACGQIKDFNSIEFLNTDRDKNDPNVFYSIDITVAPKFLHHGLGLRIKAEQILELKAEGARAIRSRNRYPEAASMIRLNHGFGSIVRKHGKKVYADGGDAFYQSIQLTDTHAHAWNPRHPSLLNKGSCANFVSPAYIDNMLILKELLPVEYRHVYLASSRGEALDKAVKCLRHFRPKANKMISFSGHHFGNTTASAATLSGETCFFDWPHFENASDPKLKTWLKDHPLDSILGAAVEFRGNIDETKKEIATLKALGIPTVLRECSSVFWQAANDNFIVAHETQPDITFFGLGPQVAAVACKKEFFFDKPLMMISTWDGDENGLCLFQDQVLKRLGEIA